MAATRLSRCSFVLALALLLAAIASAENYNPTTTSTTSEGAAAEPHPKPAYHNGYVPTPELDELRSKMHQYEQEAAADNHRGIESGNRGPYGSNHAEELVHLPEPETSLHSEPLMPEAEIYKRSAPAQKRPSSSSYGAEKKPEDELPSTAVEGIVACRSGSDYYPLQGAVVRIACSGTDEKVLCSTDERGYFFKTLSGYYAGAKPELCTAYLERSASKKCSEPTDVNKGVNGAALSSYKILHDKNIKLYPVGPFFYAMKSQPATTAAQSYSSKSPAGY